MSLEIFRRGRTWYLRGTVAGTAVYESTKLPLEQRALAEAARAQRETQLFKAAVFGERASVPFRTAALDYLKFEPRSCRTIDYVGGLIGHFGDRMADTIGQVEADAAADAICGRDAPPATKVRTVYTPLIAVLRHSAPRQWCPVPMIKKPAVPKAATQWLTPLRVLALIAGAAAHLRPLLVFLVCTGARLSEALDLDWANVDLAARRVVFRNTKAERLSENATPRVALLPPAAVFQLANLPGREGRVFRRDDGEPYTDQERYSGGQIATAWATACRNAQLPGKLVERSRLVAKTKWYRADDPEKRLLRRALHGSRYKYKSVTVKERVTRQVFVPAFTPHDLRHSWATWFYAISKDFLLLRAEGGWANQDMVDRYAHLMPTELIPQIAGVWGGDHPRIAPAAAQPQEQQHG